MVDTAERADEHDPGEPCRQQRCTEIVDPPVNTFAHARQRRRQHAEREHADRDVDVEDPPPGERAGEEPAEQRADHTRQAEHSAEQALVTAALARGDDITDRRHRADHEAAAAEPLDRPEHDEFGQARR